MHENCALSKFSRQTNNEQDQGLGTFPHAYICIHKIQSKYLHCLVDLNNENKTPYTPVKIENVLENFHRKDADAVQLGKVLK